MEKFLIYILKTKPSKCKSKVFVYVKKEKTVSSLCTATMKNLE